MDREVQYHVGVSTDYRATFSNRMRCRVGSTSIGFNNNRQSNCSRYSPDDRLPRMGGGILDKVAETKYVKVRH